MAVRTSPTGFVNLQRYLQGNQGIGQQMVGAITSGLGEAETKDIAKQGEAASGTIGSAGTEAVKKGQGIEQGLRSDASSVATSAQDYLTNPYQNPDVEAQKAGIKAAEKSAQEKASAIQGAPAQEAALQSTYGKLGPYSSGFAALDQFLIGADPQARQALQQKTESIKSQASTGAQTALKNIEAQQKKVASDVTAQQQKLRDTAEKERWKQYNLATNKKTEMNKPTADAYKYMKGTQKSASLADVMSQSELADLKALSEISGKKWDPGQEEKQYSKGLIRKVVPKAGEKFRG